MIYFKYKLEESDLYTNKKEAVIKQSLYLFYLIKNYFLF